MLTSDPGHAIGQVQVIMRIIPSRQAPFVMNDNQVYVAYVHRFDVVSQLHPLTQMMAQCPEPATSLYALKRARRADNSLLGDIIPLCQLRSLVSLIPRFGEKADPRFSKTNSLIYCNEYWLNKYFNKELFYALSRMQ